MKMQSPLFWVVLYAASALMFIWGLNGVRRRELWLPSYRLHGLTFRGRLAVVAGWCLMLGALLAVATFTRDLLATA